MSLKKKSLIISLSFFLFIFLLLNVSNTSAAKNWWEKLGKPQYGGTLKLHNSSDMDNFDPYQAMLHNPPYLDCLGGFDRTVPPEACAFNTGYYPKEVYTSPISERWETKDFATFTFHIRKGIHWQDIPPVNGRELTAEDIVYSYNRFMGNGSGFTKPGPFFLKTGWDYLESITAPDKYTLVFKFTEPSVQNLLTILEQASQNNITAPREAVEQWGQARPPNWRQVIGTGPFMIKEHIVGTSYTYVKNPNYWKYDDRWPKNKLPYVDEVKYLVIPDFSTAMAAIRSGRIDRFGGTVETIAAEHAETLKKSNPEIVQFPVPVPSNGLQLRCDLKPFSDIRVRTAMQMSMNLPEIAKGYYHGIDWKPWGTAGPEVHEINNPFDTWPKKLQEEYTYNPKGAKKLLAEAGFPNGFKTTCLVASNTDLQLLQIMQAYLKNVGIDLELQVVDPMTQRSLTAANKYKTIFFPMGMAENKPIIRIVGNLFTGYTNNFPRLADPDYDKLFKQWQRSTTWKDAEKLGKEIDMRVIKGHYRVTLMPYNTYIAYQPWLGGVNGEAGQQEVYHIAYYWLKKNIKK